MRDPDGKIIVMCKGADSIMYPLLRQSEDQHLIRVTSRYVDDYARSGLRTLIFAEKTISEDDYLSWNVEYLEASNSLERREEKLELVAEMIEKDFELIGSTAIEDKL